MLVRKLIHRLFPSLAPREVKRISMAEIEAKLFLEGKFHPDGMDDEWGFPDDEDGFEQTIPHGMHFASEKERMIYRATHPPVWGQPRFRDFIHYDVVYEKASAESGKPRDTS